ncbi:MAG: class I ribonucleotide reductase maintenance protein YfaE [Shewanella xiamenensis]|uniref:class I ribonucleotide reductase maintenance protein YfaE n=1 Tax=Shewanella sp. DNRA4 TaxID=2723055 RepID=UPI00146DCA9E|nr:class I ribonucleotide reductase maintenance protein YfaE [Shewanella sp. DNRA4]MCD8550726.1 class I ribonucleotide reductase maintenance protein YfaE [Shewanella xiamenensis]MCD8557718.1 class I ribonucleotide reductase maintenance protein YfaE [Shewanella xiamenensis]NMD53365.1 2Fe-2S ferredoxin-like protein [Shewanella sp. DNRA4]
MTKSNQLKSHPLNNPFAKAPIVRLQGQPVLLFTPQHGSLLQALEAKKVRIFSECRSGFCGACKTKVLSGRVSYITEPLAELKADECLPCCCIPSEDLELDLSPEGAAVVTYSCNTRAQSTSTRKTANLKAVPQQEVVED